MRIAIRLVTLRATLCAALIGLSGLSAWADDPWVVFEGQDGPGRGKQIVLIAADDEYRSEELIPQLAKILAKRHGFRCTVLFAIDKKDGTINPAQRDNIPGLEALKTADLLVLFARFRELPDEQMKYIDDYVNSGKPIVALRTATHAFNYTQHKDSPYAKYSFRSQAPEGGFGREVLGETWVNHYGRHQKESTRGVIAPGMENHPIVRGVAEIWGPSDVYEVTTLTGDSQPVVLGQVLQGMKPDDPPTPGKKLMPIAWIKTYTGASGRPARIFVTTMGHAGDFQNEGVRRLLVNACYWALGLEDQIPARSNVDLVGPYDPSPIGVGGHKKGIKPAQLAEASRP
ncbi:MAG: ThuA domain-containing protein [Isosphaeraceae bacterium]|nr:ThuA domain-containing protein [Isosphaeraceae bacterium]